MQDNGSATLQIMKLILLLGLVSVSLYAGPTTVLFDPSSTTLGPFPTNFLTTSDTTQQTGLRVNLPVLSNCSSASAPSVCSNEPLLNLLDGFSVNPRLMVCFSAPVDPNTLQTGINIVPVSGGSPISINQIIYDPGSMCAFARPNQVLNQQAQYLLVVTSMVRDVSGHPVVADSAFSNCLTTAATYCSGLSAALKKLQPVSGNNVVAASLFTTMSATTWLQQALTYVSQNALPPATILASLPLSNVTQIRWDQDLGTSTNPVNLLPAPLSGVGSIEFGLFPTPEFLSPTDGTIHTTPTAQPIAAPFLIPVSFHVFLPAAARPKNGYPVVIYGHGLSDSQFGAPTYIASTLAQNGFATLAFEITGHGYGPKSVVNVTGSTGSIPPLPTPGRGIQLGNAAIGPTDGCIAGGAVAVRDCGRQTAVDLFALVKAIQQTPGLNLDPTQIYYVGQSFGGTYGTLFQAVEPNVTAAVLNGAGGTSVDIARLGFTGLPLGAAYLGPLGLLNVPPASPEILFNAYANNYFNDNYVFRDTPPVVNIVPGAMPIQAAFEAADWLGMLGDPLSYAPHLQSAHRLAGVPAKSTLLQFGQGDLEVPNPTEFAVVSAAQSPAWFFLYGEAVAEQPALATVTTPDVAPLPILPHRILANPTLFSAAGIPAEMSIALAEQQQVAAYFRSNGGSNPDPNQYVTSPFSSGTQLFQPLVPAAGTNCNGTYYGLFSGNIVISSGQSCTFLAGGITGNVVENGGSLTLNGATVQGNVEINGSSAVSIGPATAIGGNLAIQNLAAAEPRAQVCGATIQGNVAFQNNATAVEIGAASACPGNIIVGNLAVQNNTALTVVFGNAVTGNLQTQNNTAATQVFDNQVANNLQCQNNTNITGSGNSAKQKQGQCVAF
jgi:dienelactone hydrolase